MLLLLNTVNSNNLLNIENYCQHLAVVLAWIQKVFYCLTKVY